MSALNTLGNNLTTLFVSSKVSFWGINVGFDVVYVDLTVVDF